MSFEKLAKNDEIGGVEVTSKKAFKPLGTLRQSTVCETFKFARDMTFGKVGEHKRERSGGEEKRNLGKIFANVFQGKLAEFALVNIVYQKFGTTLPTPDLTKSKLGKWDMFDFEYNGKKISVKSTKSFGSLLLLETPDWNEKGEYVHNIPSGNALYDFTILIRISPNCEAILGSMQLLYSDDASEEKIQELYDQITNEKWKYDVVGYITHAELVEVINNKHIIGKGELLNKYTVMDAENYYVQAGDMHDIDELVKTL